MLLDATRPIEQVTGFVAVLLGAGNAAGGYAVTDRMLAMFQTSDPKPAHVKHLHATASNARKSP